jgi:hypothetical protein
MLSQGRRCPEQRTFKRDEVSTTLLALNPKSLNRKQAPTSRSRQKQAPTSRIQQGRVLQRRGRLRSHRVAPRDCVPSRVPVPSSEKSENGLGKECSSTGPEPAPPCRPSPCHGPAPHRDQRARRRQGLGRAGSARLAGPAPGPRQVCRRAQRSVHGRGRSKAPPSAAGRGWAPPPPAAAHAPGRARGAIPRAGRAPHAPPPPCAAARRRP